jgi:hypothetical protein
VEWGADGGSGCGRRVESRQVHVCGCRVESGRLMEGLAGVAE